MRVSNVIISIQEMYLRILTELQVGVKILQISYVELTYFTTLQTFKA